MFLFIRNPLRCLLRPAHRSASDTGRSRRTLAVCIVRCCIRAVRQPATRVREMGLSFYCRLSLRACAVFCVRLICLQHRRMIRNHIYNALYPHCGRRQRLLRAAFKCKI